MKSLISTFLFLLISLTSSAQCAASFTYTVDANNLYTFINTSMGGADYFWDFGDGFVSTDENPQHTYFVSGGYNVTLTIYDVSTACADTSIQNISAIGTQSIGNCVANWTPIIAGNSVWFNNTSSGGYTETIWDFGDLQTSVDHSPFHSYVFSGAYVVCLNVLDTVGQCGSSHCDTVIVSGITNSTCTAAFSNTQSGGNIQFINNSTGPYMQCYWSFGDGNTSADFNPNHNYQSPGIYPVCLSVTNGTSVCADIFCDTVEVLDCEAAFTWQAQSDGLTIDFSNNSFGGIDYYWDFGDGNSSTNKNPSHQFSPGNYNVCLILSDPLGFCSDTICKTITVIPQNIIENQSSSFRLLNPLSSDYLYFKNTITNNSINQIYIYDLQGRLISNAILNNNNSVQKISITNLSKAMYFYQIKIGNITIYDGKFFKN